MSFRVAGARDCAPLQKWAKREGFVAFPKTMAGVGHLKRICKDAFRLAGAVQETCSSEMLEVQGADFLRGVAYLASIFRGRRSTLDRWTGKIAKRIGTRLSALHSTFHFWRKSRRILSFLLSSTSKKRESLAEFLRFGRCYVQTLRKSRRISSFRTLLCSNLKDVPQNFFVFDLADRWIDG